MNIVQDASVKQLIDGFDTNASRNLTNAAEAGSTLYDGYGPNGYEQYAGRFNVTILYKYSADSEGKKNISRTVSASFCTVTGTYPSTWKDGGSDIPSTVTINNTL